MVVEFVLGAAIVILATVALMVWLSNMTRGLPAMIMVAGVMTLAVLVLMANAAMGVGLVAGQGIDPPQFHLFYGFVALITVGIVYSYRQSLRPHRHLLYGCSGLFLMGLGIRAMLVV